MTTTDDHPDLAALACEDCPAAVSSTYGTGLDGRVLTVTAAHAPTCPWLARVAPEGAVLASRWGVLVHTVRGESSK